MSLLSGASRVKGGPALARHLAAGPGGPLRSRGLVSTTMAEAAAELAAGSMPTRTSRPLWHCHCDPAHDDPRIRPTYWTALEAEFGLQDARFFGREHDKGERPRHEHRVYDATRPDGSVIDMSFEKMRREKVSVIVAFHLRLPFPPIPHTRAVARALRSDGRQDIARWVDSQAAGPVPVAITTPQQRQQEQRTGRSLAQAEAATLAAWRASDTGAAFAAALAARGLILAQGDKVAVVIDGAATWPVARMIGAASRREGSRIDTPTVRRRLAGLTLVPVDRARPARPEALDMAAIGKRAAELQAAQARAEAAAAALAWAEPTEAVTRATTKAEKRAAEETAAVTRRARADEVVAAMEHTARPTTWIAKAWSRIRRRHTAERQAAYAAAIAEAEQARHAQVTATIMARAARDQAETAEAEWREAVAAEIARLDRRAAWLAAAVAAIERTPGLGLASDEALSAALRQARRQPRPPASPPPPPRPIGPIIRQPGPAYRPR